LRVIIITAALHHKMGNSGTAPPSTNYYEANNDGEWVLKRGQVAKGLDDRVNGRSGHSLSGCRRCAQSLLLYGLSRLAANEGPANADKLDAAVAGRAFNDLYPKRKNSGYQSFTANPTLDDLIPGDWIWMQNHTFSPTADSPGYEGCNAIYIGKSAGGEPLFARAGIRQIETFSEMRLNVSTYSGPSHRGAVESYKITERYGPLVPAPLK
jgi:hypothetical protein